MNGCSKCGQRNELSGYLCEKHYAEALLIGQNTAGLLEDSVGYKPVPAKPIKLSPLKDQVGGTHYKNLKIQPVEYIHANQLPFIEGNIVKYITRWKMKGGIEDLKKVRHYVELLIQLEEKVQMSNSI